MKVNFCNQAITRFDILARNGTFGLEGFLANYETRLEAMRSKICPSFADSISDTSTP
jgi:hypothetical protein